MKIHTRGHWEFWYDRSVVGGQCWWAIEVDSDGNQVGDALHAYTKREIEHLIDLEQGEGK